MSVSSSNTFTILEKIGSGGFSHVFKAAHPSGQLFAVKKSRVSLSVERPLLEYEAQVMKALEGHPAIPLLIGYGRFEHFEYLAMPHYGRTLADVEQTTRLPMGTILVIAIQMISVLEYIHSKGIIHRDIKPSNIIAHSDQDFAHIRLIDFGLARKVHTKPSPRQDPVDGRLNIVGTLSWASLNAYYGRDLNPRDDLESLAHVLLHLLRGSLPWHKLCSSGTAVGRIVQIREKMKTWTGSKLASGYPTIFGKLLDDARRLEFDEPIDYAGYRQQFQQLLASSTSISHTLSPISPSTSSSSGHTPSCPLSVGQLIFAQVNPSTSIVGYTMKHDNSSYWENPLYSSFGQIPFRPAVVISTSFEHTRYKVGLLPIIRSATPLSNDLFVSLKDLEPNAYLSNTYCYVFPRVSEFLILPNQPCLPSATRISDATVEALRSKFLPGGPRILDWEKTHDPIPDSRDDARMQFQNSRFYVNVESLNAESATNIKPLVDWFGKRGWFDECVAVAKRRGWEDGFRWDDETSSSDEEDQEDSYYGMDHSLWENPQKERDSELSLNAQVELPLISEVVEN